MAGEKPLPSKSSTKSNKALQLGNNRITHNTTTTLHMHHILPTPPPQVEESLDNKSKVHAEVAELMEMILDLTISPEDQTTIMKKLKNLKDLLLDKTPVSLRVESVLGMNN